MMLSLYVPVLRFRRADELPRANQHTASAHTGAFAALPLRARKVMTISLPLPVTA